MSADEDAKKSLLDREAAFWDLQEEKIDDLYARPHDWRFIPSIADRVIKPKIRYLHKLIARHRKEINSILDIGCGNGWFCHACAQAGIRTYGIDISPKKVDGRAQVGGRQGSVGPVHL